MSVTAHHAEWLTLVPHSGPFLSVGVLIEAFPDGLDTVDSKLVAELRAAYGTWSDPENSDYEGVEASELHEAFILFVLRDVLRLDEEVLLRDQDALDQHAVSLDVHGVGLRPDAVLAYRDRVRMLVSWVDRAYAVDEPLPGDAWAASPRDRMVEHLRETGCPLGLITDGERWTLVSWREGEAPGFATWWASLWLEERITLRAFTSLLGEPRFFSVPEEDTLVGLLRRSAENQSQVTTKLGNQTLEAVQILIQTLDKLDRDRGGRLLDPVDEGDLYDAAVTVMMRLIFLFYAEENELLPVGEDLYLERYAASTLRAQLQENADRHGEEVLEARSDAWPRLLATWRAVFAGVEHGSMRLAPYGGSLFDPDRYPFLEGRLPGSSWHDEPASPLPVDNRTVLHLLNALQTLEERGHRRKLSFLALDVEQIGHVYEGMLDHTAARAEGWVMGFSGVSGAEPEIPLEELERLEENDLLDLLKDRTNRGMATNRRWLKEDLGEVVERDFGLLWAPAFEGDDDAAQRIKRFAKFLRKDSQGAPVVFPPGSAYVCDSSHRGATGTHYTPRALTEGIVRETLEPLVYEGPAEGQPEEEWQVRSPDEILGLKVADPACGSGAFLVQACRYLAEKLVESRREHGDLGRDPTEEDLVRARREIAARCLYGVDKNPMAVEMAKMSLWLVTLAKDRPFSFVDHALGVGDSLFGMHDLDQLRYWNLAGDGEEQGLFDALLEDELERAIQLRKDVEAFPVVDHEDAVLKGMLLEDAEAATRKIRALGDLLFASLLTVEKPSEFHSLRSQLLLDLTHHLNDVEWLEGRLRSSGDYITPFHWALSFPEVFDGGGFDAMIGNPPFLGGDRIARELGTRYATYLRRFFSPAKGRVDLCVFFLKRARQLLEHKGGLGMVATETVTSTANRRAGLDQLVSEFDIYWTLTSIPWPGSASQKVSVLAMTRKEWRGVYKLNGRSVKRIGPTLSDAPDARRVGTIPQPIGSFSGAKLYGMSFVRTREEIEALEPENPGLRHYMRRFVNGDVLNGTADCDDRRLVLDFGERDLDEIAGCDSILVNLSEQVAKERAGQTKQIHEHRPWLLWDKRTKSFAEARKMNRIFALAADSSHLIIRACNPEWLFNQKIRIFSTDDWQFFAVLQSAIHEAWLLFMGGKRGGALSYSTRNVLRTFPWPTQWSSELVHAGRAFHQSREDFCTANQVGPIVAHNRMGDPANDDAEIRDLRSKYEELSRSAWAAYGRDGGGLEFQCRSFGERTRFYLKRESELAVLEHLVELNEANA